MSVATGPAPPQGSPPVPRQRRGPGRLRRRWHRLAIPAVVFVMLVGATVMAWAVERPHLADPQVLAPTGTGPDGASRLADLLAAEGVQVDYVSGRREAEAALRRSGDAVVFAPKPTIEVARLVRSGFQRGAEHRFVLVAPGPNELRHSGLPVRYQPARWAARASEPACGVAEALAAGPAAVERRRYAVPDPAAVCYGGGLVRVSWNGPEAFVVGASDPFRNQRIDEHGNATLALDLLGARDRVIWLDALPTEATAQQPVAPQEREPWSRGELNRTGGNAFAQLVYGYPAGVLAGLVLALLLAVLIGVARARRLGPPVQEPLPVTVPAVEAVVGWGRLYHRARGRAVVLRTLRGAAIARLGHGLGIPAPPERAALVAALVAHCGWPAAEIEDTLYGPAPETDDELKHAVAKVDALVALIAPPPGDTRRQAGTERSRRD